jgi:hypothetical protein
MKAKVAINIQKLCLNHVCLVLNLVRVEKSVKKIIYSGVDLILKNASNCLNPSNPCIQ